MEALRGGQEEGLVMRSLQETTRECRQGLLIPTTMMMMMIIVDQTLLSLIVAPEAQKSCVVEKKLYLVLW